MLHLFAFTMSSLRSNRDGNRVFIQTNVFVGGEGSCHDIILFTFCFNNWATSSLQWDFLYIYIYILNKQVLV